MSDPESAYLDPFRIEYAWRRAVRRATPETRELAFNLGRTVLVCIIRNMLDNQRAIRNASLTRAPDRRVIDVRPGGTLPSIILLHPWQGREFEPDYFVLDTRRGMTTAITGKKGVVRQCAEEVLPLLNASSIEALKPEPGGFFRGGSEGNISINGLIKELDLSARHVPQNAISFAQRVADFASQMFSRISGGLLPELATTLGAHKLSVDKHLTV